MHDKVTKVSDSLYKGYQRNGRKDWMSMVTLADVLADCENWFLPYQEYDIPIEKVQG
jgi:hypothetical protein